MKKLHFFRGKPNDFILFVLPMLHATPLIKLDKLFSLNEIIEEMYIVLKGTLSLTLGSQFKNFELAEIRESSHFGDILLNLLRPSPYELITKSNHSEIFVLKKNDYFKLKTNFNRDIMSILRDSLHDMEIYEKKRLLIMRIYKYETDHKKIIFFLRMMNNYLYIKINNEGKIDLDFELKKLLTNFKNNDLILSNEFEQEDKTFISRQSTIRNMKKIYSDPYKIIVQKLLILNQNKSEFMQDMNIKNFNSDTQAIDFTQIRLALKKLEKENQKNDQLKSIIEEKITSKRRYDIRNEEDLVELRKPYKENVKVMNLDNSIISKESRISNKKRKKWIKRLGNVLFYLRMFKKIKK
jgi:hypothetical protein